MNKIPDVFRQRLERSFPRHSCTENGVEFVGEFEAILLRMIFPRAEMRQFRRQRKHLPAMLQCLLQGFVLGDVLIDAVPRQNFAGNVFCHNDPDNNGADFAIPPEDAMLKFFCEMRFGVRKYFFYFRLDHADIVGMHKVPNIVFRRHERPFPRHIRGIDRVKDVVELEYPFIIMIAPWSQMSYFRRGREQLPAVVRSRFRLAKLLRQASIFIVFAQTPAEAQPEGTGGHYSGIDIVSIHGAISP